MSKRKPSTVTVDIVEGVHRIKVRTEMSDQRLSQSRWRNKTFDVTAVKRLIRSARPPAHCGDSLIFR